MKLFAIYVGGRMERANIEVHDMRFVLAESIEDSYAELKRDWWGKPGTLHLDAWSELTRADGYRITLKREPSQDARKLYYVNLGGYDSREFSELHKNIFVVAETESKAKVRALKTVRHWESFHKDDMYEAEQCFCLNELGKGFSIHLEKIGDETPAPFICRYQKLS